MTTEQWAIILVLGATLAALAWGRWRHDVVAMAALLVATAAGVVPVTETFSGFSNPAVLTVAAILVIARTISASGLLDALVMRVGRPLGRPPLMVLAVCASGALLSAFMNNVGALALMMPVALTLAARHGMSPSLVLMPLSFATLLGGMTTLIGTPPNLVVAQVLVDEAGQPLGLFSLTCVGGPIALAGVAWLAVAGWRLIPVRKDAMGDHAAPGIGPYQAELCVASGGGLDGVAASALADRFGLVVHGILRDGVRVFARPADLVARAGDILLVEARAADLEQVLGAGAATLPEGGAWDAVVEAVVPPHSIVLGSTADSLALFERFGVTLLAASRQGRRFEGRLTQAPLASGDVVMLAGAEDTVRRATEDLGVLRLEARAPVVRSRKGLVALAAFAVALGLVGLDVVAPHVAFMATVLVLVLAGTLDLGSLYRRVDWSVVVLLAALIPLGHAFAGTGAAARLAGLAMGLAPGGGPSALLLATLVLTALVTPVLNNVATVIVMAPLAGGLAQGMGLSPTPFVVATAIAASADFLTPFGHHNNTIVMGPGGYRFRDYWRVGLPLVVVTVVGAMILIPLCFSFH